MSADDLGKLGHRSSTNRVPDDLKPVSCLTVVMPCFNEVGTVGTVMKRVLESPWVLELIVVDDGSTDGTLEAIHGIGEARVRVIEQPVNLGKGAALRRGFAEARGPFVIVQDADLEYDPADYPAMLAPLLDDRADVVYGSRFHTHRPRRVLYFWHSVGNRFLTTLSNMFTNLNLSDMETCFKAFRAEVLRNMRLSEDGFGFEAEITAKVARGGWRVYEVGISYSGRTYAEGKKIGWRDGVRAVFATVRYSRAGASLRRRLDRYSDRHDAPVRFTDSDAELASVLESLSGADHYADWIFGLCAPHLGHEVLELGAGHGDFTERLSRSGRRVTATDISPRCVEALRRRFHADPNVTVSQADVIAGELPGAWDSVILVNVLEHIDNDTDALRAISARLPRGGRVVLFVPAFGGLYSEFDRRIGHRRRYRRARLARILDAAGLRVLEIRYVNSLGALVWWVFARQLGRVPTQRWSVWLYDQLGVPLVRRYETARMPPFGQSLFAAAERPVAT